MTIGAVVLAAGHGRRMGGPKALLVVGGVALVAQHVARFRELGCAPIVVVTRPQLVDQVEALVDVSVIGADTASQADSLRAGLAGISGAVLVTPVDLVPPSLSTLQRLVDALDDDTDAVTPLHEGHGGHPVLLRAEVVRDTTPLDALLDALGPRGKRIPVDDPAIHGDLDVPADLATA